jgi:LPXTG-motif cell wall-anchored protein
MLAVLALGVVPAGALAQSGGAGDDQYVDPIGGNGQQHSGGGSKGSGSSGGATSGPSLSAAPSLSASSGQPAPAAAPAASSGQTLPRTGFDAGAVAAIGLALVLMGLALRRRLADEHH